MNILLVPRGESYDCPDAASKKAAGVWVDLPDRYVTSPAGAAEVTVNLGAGDRPLRSCLVAVDSGPALLDPSAAGAAPLPLRVLDDRVMPRQTNVIHASRIAQLRIARGWTQHDLAERMGVSSDMIGCWERGKKHPKLSTLQRIAAALGCNCADLIDNSDNESEGNTMKITEIMQRIHDRQDDERLSDAMRKEIHELDEALVRVNGKSVAPLLQERALHTLIALLDELAGPVDVNAPTPEDRAAHLGTFGLYPETHEEVIKLYDQAAKSWYVTVNGETVISGLCREQVVKVTLDEALKLYEAAKK